MKQKSWITAGVAWTTLLLLSACTVKDKGMMNKSYENIPIKDAYEFVQSSGGIDEYTLKHNGMRVLLMEDHSAPVATFMVTYHVGSRNEAVGHTGSTHLLEHLMFKGSENFNKQNGKPIWTVLQDVGAQINATTWMDRTNYFELLPSDQLEKAMAIEADRMRRAFIADKDRQPEMTVVRNEFERGENSPYQALDKLVWATAYQAHPYHHSTIGWRSDIENVSTERLKEFYNTYYWPNNATVTLIGDFQVEEALRLVRKYFGPYTASPHDIPEVYTTEPDQEGPRHVEIRRSGEAGIVAIAHKSPAGLHEDTYALQVLSKILYGGKSSRFYKKIVDKGLATNVNIDDHPFKDNGLFVTYVFMTPGTDHSEIQSIVLNEYEAIKNEGVTVEEIKRAKAQIRAEEAFSRDGSYSIAANLNESIAIGDWTFYTNYMERINEVMAEDVQAVVKKYLIDDERTTGYFIPETTEEMAAGNAGENKTPSGAHKPYYWRPMDKLSTGMNPSEMSADDVGQGAIGTSIAEQVKTQTPLNGITLYTMETGVKDVVTLRGSLLGGDVYSPKDNPMLAEVTAAMLDQGTTEKDKFAISEQLESVGARLSFSSGMHHVRFNAKCLKDDVPLVLSLAAEQLRSPAFNDDDLVSVKKRLIGRLQRSKESTGNRASVAYSQILYPERHPNRDLSADDAIAAVEKITVADLKAYHAKIYGLGNLNIVAVGDVDNAQLNSAVSDAFGGWQTSAVSMASNELHANDVSENEKYVSMTDKTSVDMFIGQPIGIDREHPDYYPLMMGVYILGGNFSARLMATVRDQQGLTYGTYSTVSGVNFGNDGHWYVWGTYAPDLLDKGKAATLEQIEKWATDGVTPAELTAKQNTITGSYQVGLATTNGLASQILTNAERGRPLSFLDEYPEIIKSLTLEQVNGAIHNYIHPDNMVIVAAGSIDENGNPMQDDE